MSDTYTTVCALDDLPPGTVRTVEAGGRPVALCNVEGELFAVDDICPHAGASLGAGRLDGERLVCPFHAARFDLRTGAAVSGPADHGLSTYPVRVEGNDVQVAVPE
jgi:3-phenylpropionate/trans-cinnamate dioxygenase ferredoxin subunit